jgi:hypothetical protein
MRIEYLLLLLLVAGCESKPAESWQHLHPSVITKGVINHPLIATRDEASILICDCHMEMGEGPLRIQQFSNGVQFDGDSWYDLEGNAIFPKQAAMMLADMGWTYGYDKYLHDISMDGGGMTFPSITTREYQALPTHPKA